MTIRESAEAHTPFDPQISDLIRKSARKLARSPGFRLDEHEDFEQELNLHLWRQWDKYDPSGATPLGYAAVLIERKIVSIVRHRFAQRRDPQREECSMDMSVADADDRPIAYHETIPARNHATDALDARRDVAAVIEQLPRAAREEANRLLRAFTNGERSRACKPTGSTHDLLWREFSHIVDGAPPVRLQNNSFA